MAYVKVLPSRVSRPVWELPVNYCGHQAEVAQPAAPPARNGTPAVIVSGLENSGTTVLSQLVMCARTPDQNLHVEVREHNSKPQQNLSISETTPKPS